ncbi:unnamed protein product [Linum trigynum]|uniref:Secreted protein n=1 Tax=Linum trigynum TaxID=586398 RepID=A0AAV2FUU6_9ROSI
MRGALSSLLELSLWLGDRLLQLCSIVLAASMRNQKLGRERGSTTPIESGQSEINQYKLVLENPRASDDASEHNTSGAVTHAHGGCTQTEEM